MKKDVRGSGHRAQWAGDLRNSAMVLVNRLVTLYEETNPEGGEAAAANKNDRANEALAEAGDLVRKLVGWAIDHQVGLAAASRPFAGNITEPYDNAVLEADDHRHELMGARMWFSQDIPVPIQRQALLNALFANVGAIPMFLNFALRDAITGLQYGDVAPLLAPDKAYRRYGREQVNLQLAALGFISYRVGLGQRVGDATEDVARNYSVSPDAVRSWRRRVANDLGEAKVTRAKDSARQTGRRRRALPNAMAGGSEISSSKMETWEKKYGDVALQEAGRRFQTLTREKRGA
ncbi:MAG TPA: hypothetical protein VII91_06890 [Bauldia sp.]